MINEWRGSLFCRLERKLLGFEGLWWQHSKEQYKIIQKWLQFYFYKATSYPRPHSSFHYRMKRQISIKKLFEGPSQRGNPPSTNICSSLPPTAYPVASVSVAKKVSITEAVKPTKSIVSSTSKTVSTVSKENKEAHTKIILEKMSEKRIITTIVSSEQKLVKTPSDKSSEEDFTKESKEVKLDKNAKERQGQKQKEQANTLKSRAKMFNTELIDMIPADIKTSLHRWNYGEGTTPSKLVICNWNVNGLRSVLSKKLFYPYINKLKPDIICITETKMDEKSYDQAPIYIDGYHGYWNFAKYSSGYSGVAVFSKFLPKSMTQDMAERQFSQEGRILTLEFQKFMLINIYAPTTGKQLERLKYREQYDVAFRSHISRLKASFPEKPIVIVGDLNVAPTELDTHPGKDIMLEPSCTTTERKGFAELLNLGFVDVYRELHRDVRAYTWWYVTIGGKDNYNFPGLGRRLDFFLLPKDCMKWVVRCDIMRQVKGADHCPVQLDIDMQRPEKQPEIKPK